MPEPPLPRNRDLELPPHTGDDMGDREPMAPPAPDRPPAKDDERPEPPPFTGTRG